MHSDMSQGKLNSLFYVKYLHNFLCLLYLVVNPPYISMVPVSQRTQKWKIKLKSFKEKL